MPYPRLICFRKPDLDSVLAAWLLLDPRERGRERFLHLQEDAPPHLLEDAGVLCVECGGSGRTETNNFDHHGSVPLPCAAEQAWRIQGSPSSQEELVEYASAMDTGRAVLSGGRGFPLSALFSGMFLCVPGPISRFRAGLGILDSVYEATLSPEDVRPLLRDPFLARCAAAKRAAVRALNARRRDIEERALGSFRLMALVTDLPGVHGLLRRLGADISLAGQRSGQHWTISVAPGLERFLPDILHHLGEREQGWGGPAGGGIIGSPHAGSGLDMETVIGCVRAALRPHREGLGRERDAE